MLIGTPVVGETWIGVSACKEHRHLGSDYLKPFIWPENAHPCPNCEYAKVTGIMVTEGRRLSV